MMFVDADGVEAELLGIGELIEIGIVFGCAFLRVVEAVGQHHPCRTMVLGGAPQIERPIGHQVESKRTSWLHAGEEGQDVVGDQVGSLHMRAVAACWIIDTCAPGTRSPHNSA